MNEHELERAIAMKDRLNEVSPGFCLAKWDQVTMHLHNGMTHSCHHPHPHKVTIEEVKKNYRAIHNDPMKLEQRACMLRGERPEPCDYCWRVEDNNKDAVSDRYLKSSNLFEHRFDKIVQRIGFSPDFRAEDGALEVRRALDSGAVLPDDPSTITLGWYKSLIEKGLME